MITARILWSTNFSKYEIWESLTSLKDRKTNYICLYTRHDVNITCDDSSGLFILLYFRYTSVLINICSININSRYRVLDYAHVCRWNYRAFGGLSAGREMGENCHQRLRGAPCTEEKLCALHRWQQSSNEDVVSISPTYALHFVLDKRLNTTVQITQ